MLGGAYCYWSGSMVNVELFHAHFSKRARAVFDLFIFVILLTVLGVMIWREQGFVEWRAARIGDDRAPFAALELYGFDRSFS